LEAASLAASALPCEDQRMTIYLFLFIFFWVALFVITTLAFRYGGGPERTGMAIIVLGSLMTAFLGVRSALHGHEFELLMLASDGVVLLALLWLALQSVRFWPLWATCFHTITVITHIAALLIPKDIPKAYLMLQGFWVYPMFIAVILGIYGHQQALRHGGYGRGS
jgi:hypothetical protein